MQAQSVYKFPKGLQKFIYNRHKKLTEIIWGSQVMLLALMLIGLISTFCLVKANLQQQSSFSWRWKNM